MKTFSLACIPAILFLSATVTASAQMGMTNGPRFTGVWHAVVGSGAVYEFQTEGKPKRTVEVDIVGKDSAAGKDGVWIEVTMNVPNLNNGDMIIKELVAFDTSGLEMQIFKAIAQMPGRPPMEMPEALMHMRQPVQFTDVRSNEDLGSESITTPAGSFSCEHYRAKSGSGEFWVSDKVAPFGLVKAQNKSQGASDTITLTKTVTDAKDKITGTPQTFDPMKMMPQQPQQP
jgi:hypothetical protein